MRLFFLALVTLLLSCHTKKNIFTSPDFEARVIHHKFIAILPVNIIQPNSKLKAAAEEYGYAFQQQLLFHLLNYTAKNKEGQTVAFQPIDVTDSFLTQHNLSIEGAYRRKPEELAKMFGVDAVIMVTLTDEGDFTQGPAAGLSGGQSVYRSKGGPNALTLEINPLNLNMIANLYDATDGKLIWRTYRKGGTELPSNLEGLAQYYSNWIARRFPYKS